jgi:hypothetical protein
VDGTHARHLVVAVRAPVLAGLMRGDMESQGAGGGWSWVLSTLTTLLETGEELGAR